MGDGRWARKKGVRKRKKSGGVGRKRRPCCRGRNNDAAS